MYVQQRIQSLPFRGDIRLVSEMYPARRDTVVPRIKLVKRQLTAGSLQPYAPFLVQAHGNRSTAC